MIYHSAHIHLIKGLDIHVEKYAKHVGKTKRPPLKGLNSTIWWAIRDLNP